MKTKSVSKILHLFFRIARKSYVIGSLFFLLPCLLCLKILLTYKIVVLPTNRLGHLALNTNLFFRRVKLGTIAVNTRYFMVAPNISSNNVANPVLLGMYKKYSKTVSNVVIMTSSWVYFLLDQNQTILDNLGLLYRLPLISNEAEFSENIPTISFTDEERNFGYRLLERIGVAEDSKIVCIFGRDSAYLQESYRDIDWGYHDYRNMDVDTYIEGIKYLISKGYTIIRIGNIVSKPVDFMDDNFIDYSVSNEISPFLDIFMLSISDFVVGSSSGATDVAVVFNKPYLGVNYAPFLFSPFGFDNMYIPKRLINLKNECSVIPFKNVTDIDDTKLFDGKYVLEKYGISYIDNTAHEILDVVVEMEQRVSGNHHESDEDYNLMRKYFRHYSLNNKYINIKTRICIKWLKDNPKLYF